MQILQFLAVSLIAVALGACSGIETRPADTEEFVAGNYKYYTWRSEPLENTIGSTDVIYTLDPILRSELDSALRSKGYRQDAAKAQFSVDYIFTAGWRMGQKASESSNLSNRPTAMINRQVDQAVIDNAYALGGVKETRNIGLLFNDVSSKQEVWHVVITKIVENVNSGDSERLRKNMAAAVKQGLRSLPDA